MDRASFRIFLSVATFLVVGCSADGSPRDASATLPDGGTIDVGDEDGDTIRDADEARREARDTDGDGTPDFQDTDSDGDGIPDAIEAGDADPVTPPHDHDRDGEPDFIDLDSDGNGIPDAVEGTGDADGDGLADFADTDDDDDRVMDDRELAGVVDSPLDSDGDGLPNFRDPDSDNDAILDGDEQGVDTDADGLFDWEDTDSDSDGILDIDEAGDPDIRTPPIDSDMDGTPDFRDPDSDNDGLADSLEREAGTNPRVTDTDGDGVSDLIEVGAGTDATDGTDNPRTRGDFVFVVPYMEPPMPPRDTLRFRTSIQFADIYFLFDQSGSMSSEISALQSAVVSIANDLTCMDFGTACARDSECGAGQVCSLSGTCIEDPTTSACVASPWTGGGHYLASLTNVLSLQPDPTATAAALRFGTTGATEALYLAATCVATGTCGSGCLPATPGRVGCPGFRAEAVKILVAFTDEDSDGAETSMAAAAALMGAGIKMIGIWSGSTTDIGRQDLVDIVRDSGSFDRTGAPLVFNGVDAAVVPVVTAAINEIVEGVPLRVTIEATDEPDDDGDSLQFIDHLEINTTTGGCTPVADVEDTNGDMYADAFPALIPGTPVCWDIVARPNDMQMPTAEPQLFKARLSVRGDGSLLDARIVYFLVPPVIIPPDGPM